MGSTIGLPFIIQKESENILRSMLPNNWLIREQKPDFYIDYSVEIGEHGEPTGNIFYVQLKGISNLKPTHKEIKYQLKSKHLKYFRDVLRFPVFLIVIDINQKEGYWVFLQKYIIDTFKKGIPNQTKSIRIPVVNILSDNMTFHSAIIESQKYMTDLYSTSIIKAYTNIKSSLEKNYPGASLKFLAEKNHINISIKNSKIPLKIRIKEDKTELYKEQIEQYKKSGEIFVFKTEDIIIENFDLLNDLIKDANINRLEINNYPTINSSVSILTRDNNNHVSTILNTISGKTQIGKEYSNFSGSLQDSPFNISMKYKLIAENKSVNIQLHLNIDYTKWADKNILYLPHEEKLYNFFNDLKNNYEVELQLESQGNHLFTLKNKFENIYELADGYLRIHKFIFVCKSLKHIITFPDYHDIFKINKTDLEIMYHLILDGEFSSPGMNFDAFVEYDSLNKNVHVFKGMIIEDMEMNSDFGLEILNKKIELKNVKVNLKRFEIEEIIIKENEGQQTTKLILKENKDSKVIYSYKPELSDKLL
jgi:hypothetical protein